MSGERTLNGWPVIHSRSSKLLVTDNVPGLALRLTLHRAAAPVLLAVAAEVHERVHSLTKNNSEGQDEAGYTYRAARGSDQWSNHASGTAIDLNWRMWPMFKDAMTPKQKAACRLIVRDFSPVIAWGGDWSRKDQMHFEIRRGITADMLDDWTDKHIGPNGRLKKK